MRWHSFFLISCLVIGSFSIAGCQKKHAANKEVQQLVKRMENASPSKKSVTTDASVIPSVTYHVSTLRDPFEVPELVRSKKQYPNTILKDQSLDSLKLVGVMLEDKKRWIVLRASNGKLYKMTEGVRVGLQNAVLTKIEQNQAVFIEEVEMGLGLKPREIVIHLEESGQ